MSAHISNHVYTRMGLSKTGRGSSASAGRSFPEESKTTSPMFEKAANTSSS